MHIRPYTETDLAAVVQLFTDAIHGLAASHYDAAQRDAWAPQPPDLTRWRERVAPLQILVAEEGGTLLGFVGYERSGYIDLMFTSPAAARRGIASRLLARAQAELQVLGVPKLFTNASLLGRPFFERQGFSVTEEQQISLRGASFRRFSMAKILTAPAA
ncbi:MAG: GNAT family N-acetyltransferase [Polaromonas sp.]